MVVHFQSIIDKKESESKRKTRRVKPIQTYSTQELFTKRLVLNVTGRVMDANGEPLIGVNVQIKGTNKGASTDIEGCFSLNDIGDQAVLMVSYIGYKSQEVPVGGRTSVTIVMQEDAQTLDEVVVVGYGTQKKVNLTGSVSSISSEALENKPLPDVGEVLRGVSPNLI